LPANNGTAVLTVKVEYSNAVTTQPDKTIGNLTVTLDYVQDDGSSVTPGGETAADKLIAKVTDSGDGLYEDEYESGRYIYKGANPDNYITFNNESWRIMSVESDGTLKIMKKDSIGTRVFDVQEGPYNSNNWARPARLNTYLNNENDENSYYNSLNNESQNLIQEHQFSVGPVGYNNANLAMQIQSENETTWNGKMGLMTVSEFLRSNTNKDQCGNFNLNNTNYSTCKTTNYIVPSSDTLWTISPFNQLSTTVFFVLNNGSIDPYGSTNGVLPVLYLKSEITLDGEGTSSNPYRVVSE
ncbi:MAG: hypothetical protein HFH45_04900, partial [Bacilli bacterium]|nr:hypothetical protein [Bacilli bacterium]